MKGIPQHGLLAAFSSCPLAPASINATLCKALGGLSTFYFRKVCSFREPRRDPQCCLCNFLAGQPENGWPLEGKYCILPNPSRESGESGLHVQVPYNMYEKSISQWTCWTGGRYPMPAEVHLLMTSLRGQRSFQKQCLLLWELRLQAIWAQTTLFLKL